MKKYNRRLDFKRILVAVATVVLFAAVFFGRGGFSVREGENPDVITADRFEGPQKSLAVFSALQEI